MVQATEEEANNAFSKVKFMAAVKLKVKLKNKLNNSRRNIEKRKTRKISVRKRWFNFY